jgi:hypothetical protein
MTKQGDYTGTAYWADGDYAEEFDFHVEVGEKPVEVGEHVMKRDYAPGCELVGVVDAWTNTVIYNPLNLGTRTSW